LYRGNILQNLLFVLRLGRIYNILILRTNTNALGIKNATTGGGSYHMKYARWIFNETGFKWLQLVALRERWV